MAQLDLSVLKKLLARLVIAGLVCLLVLLLAVGLFFDSLAQLVIGQARQQINGDLKTGQAHLKLTGATLDNVVLSTPDGETAVEIPEVRFGLNPFGWIGGNWSDTVTSVTLVRPGVRIIVDETGGLNLTRLLPADLSGDSSLLETLNLDLVVEDGYILYRDQRGTGFLYELDQWNGRTQFRAGQPVDFAFEMVPFKTDSSVSLTGEVTVARPGVHLKLGLDELELHQFSGHPGFGPGLTLIEKGTLTADLVFQGEADLWGQLGRRLYAIGSVTLREASFQTPTMPVPVESLSGTVRLVGEALSTEGLEGKVEDLPFRLWGEAEQTRLNLSLSLPSIPLQKLARFLQNPPTLAGQAQLDATLEGSWEKPAIEGELAGEDLQIEDQTIKKVSARFRLHQDLVDLVHLEADTTLGQVQGGGLVFLGPKPRLVLRLKGTTSLAQLAPDLAQGASFELSILGDPQDPLVVGRGTLAGLGDWSLGLEQANSHFVANKKAVFLYSGEASGPAAQVDLPLAVLDNQTRELTGSFETNGFQVAGQAQGQTAELNFAGQARFWGDIDKPEQFKARGFIRDGSVSLGPLKAEALKGDFLVGLDQVILPLLSARLGRDNVSLLGRFSPQQEVGEVMVSSPRLDLGQFGLPGGSGRLAASVRGGLASLSTFDAVFDSSDLTLAGKGFRRPDGRVGLSTWASAPGPGESRLEAMGAAQGHPENLQFDYTGQMKTAEGSEIESVQMFGEGLLKGSRLTLARNLLTWKNPFDRAFDFPVTRYQGHAYGFFGPSMAGPLQQIPVDSFPFPHDGSVIVDGQAELARQRLDLDYQASGLDLRWLAATAFVPRGSFNSLASFSVDSGLGFSQGKLSGTFANPILAGQLEVPWLLLKDEDTDGSGFRDIASYSLASQLRISARALTIDELVVSSRAFDPRVLAELSRPEAELRPATARARGQVAFNEAMEFDLRLQTSAWKAGELSIFVPGALSYLIPYGKLSTDNLHLWGPLSNPSAAGTVVLDNGGLWLAGHPIDIASARMDFSSQQGELRITDFQAYNSEVELRGEGRRGRDGSLSGQVWADDLPLSMLEPLGQPFEGLSGQVDVALALESGSQTSPSLYVGLESQELTWNPASLTGQGTPFSLQRVLFGRVEESGSRPTTGPGLGVELRLLGDRVLVSMPEGSVGVTLGDEDEAPRISAEGGLTFGFPQSEEGWKDYFVSAEGPDFGRAGEPFRVQAERLSKRSLARLLGLAAGPGTALVSGQLELEGQWHRDHLLGSGVGLPRYRLALDSLAVEGQHQGTTSGFRLSHPAELRYEREPEAGRLVIDPLALSFFRTQQLPDQEPQQVPAGQVEVNGSVALMEAPGSQPDSNLRVKAGELPLQNIAFLFPDWIGVEGLTNFELDLVGPLLTPKLSLVGRLSEAVLGRILIAEATGMVSGSLNANGIYEIGLGGSQGQAFRAYLGQKASPEHVFELEGIAELDWQQSQPLPEDRLSLAWQNQRPDPSARVDIRGTFIDSGLELAKELLGEDVKTVGGLNATLALEGTFAEPTLSGSVQVADASLESPRFGKISDLNILTRFVQIAAEEAEATVVDADLLARGVNRYSIERFEGKLGEADFQATGKVEMVGFQPTFIDLAFNGQALPLQLGNLFRGTADVALALVGEPQSDKTVAPFLSGSIDIPEGDVTAPISLLGDDSTPQAFSLGAIPFLYDLKLSLGDDFWAYALDSSVRARGEVQLVNKTPGGAPAAFGRLALSRGTLRIPFYDASFRLRQGYAAFRGSLNPYLEKIEAITDLGGYRIIARVDGGYPDDLNLELLSDPPLPQAELSRLVVLGGLPTGFDSQQANSASNQTGFQGFLASQGVSFVSGILANRLTEGIGRLLFLSEFSFEYIPPANYVVKLAKALDPNDRFLVTVTQIIQENGLNENLFGVEWRFTSNLLVRTAFDQVGQARLWFQSISRF